MRSTPNENAADIAKIRAYLTTLPAAPVVVIKEVKLTAVSGIWFEAARLAGFDIATVIRGAPPAGGHRVACETRGLLALRSSLAGVRQCRMAEVQSAGRERTRGVPRVFVEYANLLEDWRREVKRVSAALEIDLSTRDAGAIEEFLTPDLRHHQHGGPVPEPFGTDWMSVVYGALHAAARDEPWDESALDRVFEAYAASEHGFRTAFEDYQRYQKLDRLLLPSLVKLALEGLAIAHRRRGTWA